MQAQLSAFERRGVDAQKVEKADLQSDVVALRADSSTKQAQIDSLVTQVETHAGQIDRCLNASNVAEPRKGGAMGN